MLILTVTLLGWEKRSVAFNETLSPNTILNKNPREERGKGKVQFFTLSFQNKTF